VPGHVTDRQPAAVLDRDDVVIVAADDLRRQHLRRDGQPFYVDLAGENRGLHAACNLVLLACRLGRYRP
jgi:hypothetical protein